EQRSLTLKLRKRKPDKKVEWSSDTVDNEHLGRRSSKCERPECPQRKPRAFGESSSESSGEEEEEEEAGEDSGGSPGGSGGSGGCGHQHCIRGHKRGRGRRGRGPQTLPHPEPP
ncbi:PP1RB ligase, partial [Erythrocercus mccallii]|nr:PP1RB ligase [Erythrocercus mccallii]